MKRIWEKLSFNNLICLLPPPAYNFKNPCLHLQTTLERITKQVKLYVYALRENGKIENGKNCKRVAFIIGAKFK